MTNVNTPITSLPVATSISGSEITSIVQGGTTKQATLRQTAAAAITANFPATIEFVIDAGGANISPGVKGYLEVPFDCTTSQLDMYVDQVGSCQVDIWRCTYSQFDAGVTAPTSADYICGSTISADTKATASVTSVTLSAGDILAYNVVSAATVLRITQSLKVLRVYSS